MVLPRPSFLSQGSVPHGIGARLAARGALFKGRADIVCRLEEGLAAEHDEEQLKALRLALRLFDIGQTNDRRQFLAACLARQRAMREPSIRALIMELRGQASRY